MSSNIKIIKQNVTSHTISLPITWLHIFGSESGKITVQVKLQQAIESISKLVILWYQISTHHNFWPLICIHHIITPPPPQWHYSYPHINYLSILNWPFVIRLLGNKRCRGGSFQRMSPRKWHEFYELFTHSRDGARGVLRALLIVILWHCNLHKMMTLT